MKSDKENMPALKGKALCPQNRPLTAMDICALQPGPPATASACENLAPPSGGLVNDPLQESQDRLHALFEGVETGIFIIDPETHHLVDANSVAVKMVGAPREKIVGSLCHEFVCPAEKGRCPVTDLGQTVDNSERVLLTASGERRSIIKTVRRVVISGRTHLLESFLDITERKRAEKQLKERTAYLDSLIDVTPLGVLVLDAEERVVMSNAAFERLFLYTREEAKGASLTDLLFPGGIDPNMVNLQRQCLEEGSVEATTRRCRKDGSLVDVRIFAARLDIDGKPCGFLALYEDITAQVQAERLMAERIRLSALAAEVGTVLTGSDNPEQAIQKFVQLLADRMKVAFAGVWTVNETKRVLELQASAGMETIKERLTVDVPIGNCNFSRIAEDGEPYLSNDLQQESWLSDAAWVRREQIVAFAGFPLKVKERVAGVVAVFARQPLTYPSLETFASAVDNLAQFIESKRAEESLRESEDRFRTAFEDAPYGMCMTAPDGHFMHANAALCAMLGYSLDELLAGTWPQLTHPEDMERSRNAGIELSRGGSAAVELEKRFIHKSGSIVWARLKIMPVRQSNSEISYHIAQIEDITLRKQADAAKAFLASLVESSPDAIVGMTLDGTVVSWNQGARELTGHTAEEVIGTAVSVLLLPERMSEARRILNAVGSGEQMSRYETALVCKDGTRVSVSLTISPIRDTNGGVTGIAAIAHDITARKLREQQTLLQTAALESTANGMVITDRSGRILWVNPAFTRLTGYTAEEAVGQRPNVLKSGTQNASYYQDLWSTILRGDTWHGELVNRRKNGTLYDEEMTITPVRAADGSIQHFVAVKQDVTERKREQQELLFKTTLLETEAETTIDGILVVDRNGRRLQANRRFAEIFKIPQDILEGDDDRLLLNHVRSQVRDPDGFLAQVKYLYAHESEKAREEIETIDGRYIDRYTAPLHDVCGRYYGRVWYFRDITDSKRAHEELLFKTALLENEAESTLDGIMVVDSNGRLLQVNRRFNEIFNIPPHLLNQDSDKAMVEYIASHLQDPAAFFEQIQYLYAHQWEKSRDEIQFKDGRCIDRYTAPLRDASGAYYGRVAYFRDITDSKRAEQALREKERRYRELFENASEIIFITDLEGRFTSLNRAAQQTFGYSQEEAAQTDIWRLVVPEYAEVIKQNRIQMMAGEAQLTTEIEVVAKDGRRVRLEVNPRLIWQGDNPVGIQAIARDITGRDIAEMELRQAQKLESVGRLASGIAHEINTPIQFVGDNTRFLGDSFASLQSLLGKFAELRDAASLGPVSADLLDQLQHVEEESDVAYLLDEIPRAITQTMEGVDRVATIVRAMKEFAHPESKEMAPADLNKALASTMTVARNEWKYVAEVETEFADLPLVICNVGDLNQVFLNLLVNAAHAIADVVKGGGKGRITIRTAAEGDKVHISIADTGSGIPESIRTRIFDPFFTTKEVGRGTGQGLAIARSVIVERHKGTLNFESEVGKGTTFHIRLPVSQGVAAKEYQQK
ncbi:MAG TPA: PAS domain S-box protein [Terracidiphilus sp.]|nr:PAS domain S-box protein [Terracidiphilus sp.]